MSAQSANTVQDNSNISSLSKINKELYEIFNNRIYIINNFMLKNENLKSDQIIDLKELDLFNFFLIYLTKTSKIREIKAFLKLNKEYYKKNNDHIIFNKRTIELYDKLNQLLPKFFNICIFNSYNLCKFINYDNQKFVQKIFELIRIYYLNNLIDDDSLINIIRLKLISCLYKEDANLFNKEILDIKNKMIVNTVSFEVIIGFLVSFKTVNLSKKKITSFINIINNTMKIIEDLFFTYNNIFLISNATSFYKLIELSQISLDCIDNIIPLLMKVYKFSFKIDNVLNDLSEQFLFKKNENINKKNNNIIAKNYFLYELFYYEYLMGKEEKYLIKHGFVFNDNPNNGIILYNNNSFTFPNDSFSIVISFSLINDNIKNKKLPKNFHDNRKYTIFSLSKNENVISFNIFIEKNILKMTLFGKVYQLFDKIEYNQTYVLWQFLLSNNKKSKTIFYLNERKVVKENLFYPKGIYDINLGFDSNKNQNNFVGILGTFILFNKSFIKEENSKNTKFFEGIISELKANYEDIIYINYNVEYSSLEPETQKILEKLSATDIQQTIEIIISSKSVMSNDFCCCSTKNRKAYKANYFSEKNNLQAMITFNDENIDINLDNYNFNCQNCLITYPIHFYDSFPIFIRNEGIKFLELELYYFISIIGSYSILVNKNEGETKDANEDNELNKQILKLGEEKQELYYKLKYIFNLFLYCLKTMNKTQEKQNQKDIINFFCTLNNLITLNSKNGFKIDFMFLNSLLSHIDLLITKKKFFNYCEFILEFDTYETNDDKIFELLFQTILIYLDEHIDDFLSPKIFSKLMNFDQIYLYDNLKEGRKLYSKLIRKCLSLIIVKNKEECLLLYIQKMKELRRKTKIFYRNYTQEEILEEPENNLSKEKKLFAHTASDISLMIEQSKINEKEREKEEKELTKELILTYKSLRNLFLSLKKKNDTYNIFIIFCQDNEDIMFDLFNDEFNYFSKQYEIRKSKSLDKVENTDKNDNNESNENKDNKENKENDDTNNYEDSNSSNNSFNLENISQQKTKGININLKNLKYSELIKSLCIRFLDDITYEENIRTLNSELSKDKKSSQGNKGKRHSLKPDSTIFKSLSSLNLLNTLKGAESFYLDSKEISSDKLLDFNQIEEILMKNYDFYYEFTLSPYTFNSFFLLLFRNMPNEAKLKYIKNIEKQYDKCLFSKKNYNYFILTIIILKLIQRVGEEELDNYFMNKLEFLDYVYERFNSLLFDMLEYYNGKKNEYKNIISKLFCKEDYGTNFFLSIFDSLKRQKDLADTCIMVDNKYVGNKKQDKTNEIIENFLTKVKKSLYDIIDKTIYEFTDPFYFDLLYEIYIKDYNDKRNCDFTLKTIEYIINKFNEFENKNSYFGQTTINEKNEINNYNLLLLIYKITFFIPKRQYLVSNTTFIQTIVLYLSEFCNKTELMKLKILFPIGGKNDLGQENKKLILEILFEIFIELYIEFVKISDLQKSQMFEAIINELFISRSSSIKNETSGMTRTVSFSMNSNKEKVKKKKEPIFKVHTICYYIDEFSIKEKNDNLKNLKNYILTNYLKSNDPNENIFSVTILFLIKLTIYINKLEEFDKDSSLLYFLLQVSEFLCKDSKILQQKYSSYNPLISKNIYQTDLYEDFLNYILKDYISTKTYNKEELLLKINKNKGIAKIYNPIAFKKEGRAREFTIQNQVKLISFNRKKSMYTNSSNFDKTDSFSSKNSEKEDCISLNKLTPKPTTKKLTINSTKALTLLDSVKSRINSLTSSNKKEFYKNVKYKIKPKFMKFFLRSYFSLYFLKLLNYDEDFINIRKIYNYIYHNEIIDLDDYNLNYPSKLKNRLGNNYTKHFLKKDFNFTSDESFQYSHKCIHERNFFPKTKNLFPNKKILEEYDYAHRDIILTKDDPNFLTKSCELITYQGTVFGYIYIFQNCVIFKSDLENDKRKTEETLEYACCSMEFDFLEEKKIKIIEFKEVKEVVCHKFIYSWISSEILMKNGKSYFFNFFTEENNNYVLDLFKNNNIFVIKNVKEYFDKNECMKKWKDGQLSTYEYLLLLNKLSSRTYNDANQYPVMPWIFLSNDHIRNFDIPMSIQDEELKNRFLKIPYDSTSKENRWHSNHYSSSAYICYYLMRINPFTDSMIKFQSNNFDVPDRQFFGINQTLNLCQSNNNNREPIPELYTIPEVYVNLNYNDFGKQTLNTKGRIHNVEFMPYAYNAYEFVYKFKFMLNNDEEVNTKINMWFDFIFGINQFNKDNINGKGLRNFNKYCYGQNVNIKNTIITLKKKQKSEKYIYDEIKSILGMVFSFGQCPFQLLTSEHCKRIYTKGIHNILLSSADKTKLNKDEQDLKNDTSENDNDNADSVMGDGRMVQKLYDDNSKKYSIIYFRKSLLKNNLYCLLNNKVIEVYQKDSRYKEYKFKKRINVSKNYLLFKKTTYGYPILKPKYLFCELKEEHFIFCRYLENSIRLVLPNMESKIVLDSFVTSVIRINEREFITGDNKGKLSHWRINYENAPSIKLNLVKKIKSNNNSITAIVYDERLNIIISSDDNTAIIRSFHDFEFLTYINIYENEIVKNICNEELVVDIKISNYDLVYILINKGNNNYKLKGYSLNGICFGEFEGKITNFELTKEGKVLVGLADMGLLNVLDPIDFKVLYSRFIISSDDDTECMFYHFYFEKPNIIFFGFKDQEGSKIKLITLNKGEIKFFL